MRVSSSWNRILAEDCNSVSINIIENNSSNNSSAKFVSTDSVFDAIPHSGEQFTSGKKVSTPVLFWRIVLFRVESRRGRSARALECFELGAEWLMASSLIGSSSGWSSLRSNGPYAPHPTLPHRLSAPPFYPDGGIWISRARKMANQLFKNFG